MYYVYCLQHQKTKQLYYGYTNDLRRRHKEHKREDNLWELVYYEAYRSEIDARRREQKLKQYGQSRTHLKRRINNSLLNKYVLGSQGSSQIVDLENFGIIHSKTLDKFLTIC